MYIYLLIIVLLFVLSLSRVSKELSLGVCFLLMLFLCFGYMTGSDWRAYESEYYDEFTVRMVEPGYMLLSNMFSRMGVNFWVFHILFKCLFFMVFIQFFSSYVGKRKGKVRPTPVVSKGSARILVRPHNEFYCGLMLWVASFGLYMLINCPFRNVIACTFVIPAFTCLLQKRYVWYYVLVLLAISFHYSALLMLFLPLVKIDKLSTRVLVIIYVVVMLVMAIGGSHIIFTLVSRYLPPVLQERILFYEESAEGRVFSIGLIPRLLCLWGILTYRTKIVRRYKYGSQVLSFCYFYLIISLVYYAFPVLFRSALFLAPFYILGIVYVLDSMKLSLKIPAKLVWFAIALAITFTTVRTSTYVPYTNILYHVVTGKMYDYDFRDKYNPRVSPYYTPEQY